MSTQTAIDISKASSFLRFLFEYENKDLFIEIRILNATNNTVLGQHYFKIDEIGSEKFESLIQNNMENNVYFGVLPRSSKEGKSENVKTGRVLWLDYDDHLREWSHEEARKTAEELNKKIINAGWKIPNILTFTGRGLGLFWIIDGELEASVIKKLESNLIEFLKPVMPNIDPKVKDLARIMRLPYTFNNKYKNPIKTFSMNTRTLQLLVKEDLEKLMPNEKEQDFDSTKKKLSGTIRKEIANLFSTYWVKGHRHSMLVGLVGMLKKNNVDIDHIKHIVKSICKITEDDEADARIRMVDTIFTSSPSQGHAGIGYIAGVIWNVLHDNTITLNAKQAELAMYRNKLMDGDLLKDDLSKMLYAKFASWRINDFKQQDRIKEVTASELMRSPIEKIDFYVNPLIPKGRLIMITGKPSSAKSLVAQYLGLCIASGRSFLGHATTPIRVGYLDAENGEFIFKERLHYFKNALGMDADECERFSWLDGSSTKISDSIKQACETKDIIIIDSYRRFLSGDESKSEVVNSFYMNVLKPLRDAGKTIILIHHEKKRSKDTAELGADEMIRGSSDISAQLDLHYALQKSTEEIREDNKGLKFYVDLIVGKNRLGLPIAPFTMQITKDDEKQATKFDFIKVAKILSQEEKIKEIVLKVLDDGDVHKTSEMFDAIREEYPDIKDIKAPFFGVIKSMVNHRTIVKHTHGQYRIRSEGLDDFF